MPHSRVEIDDDLMEWDYGAHEGRRTVDIEVERPGWRLFRDGCPGGETLDSVGARADRVVGRIRASGGNMLLFAHREILRVLAMRWIGLAPMEGRRLLLATASLSALGYDHDLASLSSTRGTTAAPPSRLRSSALQLEMFVEGDALYDAMVGDIGHAERSVRFESYILASDAVGDAISVAPIPAVLGREEAVYPSPSPTHRRRATAVSWRQSAAKPTQAPRSIP